ncbi:MAG: xanthine dehydrogenase family protein [Planctomycetes bacterium]|nr:xanthine dehydrogenase family protein [Planctomycetota bacterium]
MGASVGRKEGQEKTRGAACYVDDMTLPGMLHGVTVRSRVPRGRIRGIRYEGDIPWNEFTIVTARDIPGKNVVTLLTEDQPFLADQFVNHPEEAIVLLAHTDRFLLEEARRHVAFDIDPLPPVFSIEDSLARKAVVWGEDNVMKSFLVEKGKVDDVWARADLVFEGEYETGAQEQLYIEPQGMIAQASPADGVTVWGSLQCPYYVHKALMPLFGLPPDRVRVVQMTTGGGFGGKEEYPSMIGGHAALLSWKAGGRPVKIIYDRAEDMVATTKRHPSRTRHKTALSRDGRLLGMEIDFVVDAGAYVTLSPVVLSRGTIHAAGPYRCDHVRIRSRAVATNAPPHGAFRGFGAPQSIFALERHLDRAARALGLSPEELRRRNLLRQGETTATQQEVLEKINLPSLLDLALEKSEWRRRKEEFAAHNRSGADAVKKGLGLAVFFHGSGFTGSGESYLASVVGAEAGRGGRVTVLAASTEIGQGTNTIFSQIVADALAIPYDWVEVAQPDTSRVPNSGPTVASRTAMIVGKLVETAALGLRDKLRAGGFLGVTYDDRAWAEACDRYLDLHGTLQAQAKYELPPHVKWDDKTYTGAAYGAFGWAVYVAAVSVDTVTYETRVDDFVAVQDIGRVLHPVFAAGQVEGGVAQAIGFALYENVILANGRMVNGKMTNYVMPTSVDLPPIRVFFQEVPYEYGPAGAKGVGELPMDGPAPAILNAIEDALGVSVRKIPALPEVVMEAAGCL